MEDRFRFRGWYYNPYNEKDCCNNQMFYDIQDTYDYIGGSPAVMANCFGSVLDDDNWIIEQCTGYRDCKGTPIFVGDICSIKGRYKDDKDSEWLGTEWIDVDTIEMVYSLESFFGESMIKGIYTALKCDTLEVEVIGNIHENPELVEE